MIRKFLQPDGSYLISSKRRNLGYVRPYSCIVRKDWGDGKTIAGSTWVEEVRWIVFDIKGRQDSLSHPTMWSAINELSSNRWLRDLTSPPLPGKKNPNWENK